MHEKFNDQRIISKKKSEKAVQKLKEHISEIPTVKSWAKEIGISREWLCIIVKTVYGKSPKILLREIRYEKVVRLIQNRGLNANCYSVAVDAGFRDSAALSKFLKSHYGTNFTNLKTKIIKGDLRIDST